MNVVYYLRKLSLKYINNTVVLSLLFHLHSLSFEFGNLFWYLLSFSCLLCRLLFDLRYDCLFLCLFLHLITILLFNFIFWTNLLSLLFILLYCLFNILLILVFLIYFLNRLLINFWFTILVIKIFLKLTNIDYFFSVFIFADDLYFCLGSIIIYHILWTLFYLIYLIFVTFLTHFLFKWYPLTILLF